VLAAKIRFGGNRRLQDEPGSPSGSFGLRGRSVQGEQLEQREVAHVGDYLYVPAGIAHMAVNRSETPVFAVGARTDPHEQESVVLRPELDKLVP
jgi:uncharacterized RmlC-like cupin family protein